MKKNQFLATRPGEVSSSDELHIVNCPIWTEIILEPHETLVKRQISANGILKLELVGMLRWLICTLVTQIVEVLRISVMGGNFFHVMVPLEDIVEFMNANMVSN